MATYNVLEAKTNLSRLLQSATDGEEVIIARAGEPVAKLVPIVKPETKRRRKFGDNFLGITSIAPEAYDDLPLDMWECMSDEEDTTDTGLPTK